MNELKARIAVLEADCKILQQTCSNFQQTCSSRGERIAVLEEALRKIDKTAVAIEFINCRISDNGTPEMARDISDTAEAALNPPTP